MKLRGGIMAVLSLGLLLAPNAHAADAGQGISISPLRRELTVHTGQPNSSTFTITNQNMTSIDIALSVKEFSVSDYTYDYTFTKPTNDWIKLDSAKVTLKPGQSKSILYDVEAPAKATPGGYYFTLLASADIDSGGVKSTIQASSLLYATVEGKLVRTSVLKNSSIPWLVVTPTIPYKFDVLDTGNVYFSAIFFGQVDSLFGSSQRTGTTNIVFPGKPRTIANSTPSPFWPGVYRVTYGYKVDFADITTSQTAYILYLPPWAMVGGIVIVLLLIWSWQLSRAKQTDEQ
jgi:hypothetical protein